MVLAKYTVGGVLMFNLGNFINANILWVVPVISIVLTLLITVVSTPDEERLTLKDLLSVGINLCVSALTVLVTNYKSSTTAWLILLSSVAILFVATLTRKYMWKFSTSFKVLASVIMILLGITLFVVDGFHFTGIIHTIIP